MSGRRRAWYSARVLRQRVLVCMLLGFTFSAALLGCNRAGSDATDASGKTELPAPTPATADITVAATLIARRPTHLTVSRQGNLYFVQELPGLRNRTATTS